MNVRTISILHALSKSATFLWQRRLLTPLIITLLIIPAKSFWTLDHLIEDVQIGMADFHDYSSDQFVLVTLDPDDERRLTTSPALCLPSFFSSVDGAKAWRKAHAFLIKRLADAGAQVIAFDIYFEEESRYDAELAEAIVYARGKGCTVILANRGRPLARSVTSTGAPQGLSLAVVFGFTGVRAYRLFGPARPDGNWQIASIALLAWQSRILFGKRCENRAVFEFEGEKCFLVSEKDGERRKLLDTPFLGITYNRYQFPEMHYRYILPLPEAFTDEELKSKVGGRIVLVGVYHPGDLHRVPFVPPGQPQPSEKQTFGLYIHAHALNQLLAGQNRPWTLNAWPRAFCLLVGAYLFFAVFQIAHKFIRCTLYYFLALIVLEMLIFGVLLFALRGSPVFSLVVVSSLLAAIFIYPRLLLSAQVRMLEKTIVICQKRAYTSPGLSNVLFKCPPAAGSPIDPLSLICRNPAELASWIKDLFAIIVEGPGATQFEFIPVDFFAAHGWLRDTWEASTKRKDCVARADYLDERFIGTQIRRIRNIIAHKPDFLAPHVLKLGEEALRSLGGPRNKDFFQYNEVECMRLQQKCLIANYGYALMLMKWLGSS